jgi:hypothetical protein
MSANTARQRFLRNQLNALADVLDQQGRPRVAITLTPDQHRIAEELLNGSRPARHQLTWRAHPLLCRAKRSRRRP